MPGFDTGGVLFCNNVDFTGTSATQGTAQVTTDGQLLIGSTATPNIKVGTLTSPLGTVAIGYSSPNITLDITGGAVAIEKINLQTGTTPCVPSSGAITFNGAVVAAGTNPVRTDGTAANTMALEVQISQAIASTDATKIGLSNFNSAQFTVDANGFVSSKSSGAFAWTDEAVSFNAAKQNGYFITAASVTATLPASPSQGDTIAFVVDANTKTFVIQANTGQIIRSGLTVSGAAGTATNNAGQGDAITLVYRNSDTAWISTSTIGSWDIV